MAGGCTRAALTMHQARRNNMADVSAKDGSQVRLLELLLLLLLMILMMRPCCALAFAVIVVIVIVFDAVVSVIIEKKIDTKFSQVVIILQ